MVSNNILNFISICTQDQCFDERELRFLTERERNTVRKSSQGYDASHKFYRRTVWYRSTSQMFKRQNNSRYNWNEKMHLTFERSDYITSTCSELAYVFNRISVLPMLVHFKSRIFLSSSCVLRYLIFGKWLM